MDDGDGYDEVWRRSAGPPLAGGLAHLRRRRPGRRRARLGGVAAWRGWDRRGVSDADAYLRRAVVNEATDRFRSRARDRRWLDRRTGEGRGARAVDDVAERADLAAALGRLPVGQRAVIVLRYWADLPEVAIAAALRIRTGTVKSRARRALVALAVGLDRTTPIAAEASDV